MDGSRDGSGSGSEAPVPQVLRYKQRLEKSTGGEVVLMEWSPTMDLLAVALADHSVMLCVKLICSYHSQLAAVVYVKVVLNRLSWQRVWVIAPCKTPVTAITWRPDGRGM